MKVTLEVIAVTVDDAIAAERGGADRIELIANFVEGGTTASPGIIRAVKQAVSIPVFAMVRPHGGGFVYTPAEVEAMEYDAALAAEAGADGIVVGMVREDGSLDKEALARVLAAIGSLPVTFHRAFDTIPLDTMPHFVRQLAGYPQIQRLLTSGGHDNPYAGQDVIRDLVGLKQLSIMPGGGVVPDTVRSLIDATGVTEVHFGTAARQPHEATAPVSEDNVRRIRDILDKR